MDTRTLDDVLAERALNMYEDTLRGLMDITSWTAENRDQKFEEILKLSDEICDTSVEHTARLMTENLNGKPVLYWKMREQFLVGQLEFLKQVLSELHEFEDEKLETLPVDYEWVIARIRQITQILSEEAETTAKFMQAFAETVSTEVQEL